MNDDSDIRYVDASGHIPVLDAATGQVTHFAASELLQAAELLKRGGLRQARAAEAAQEGAARARERKLLAATTDAILQRVQDTRLFADVPAATVRAIQEAVAHDFFGDPAGRRPNLGWQDMHPDEQRGAIEAIARPNNPRQADPFNRARRVLRSALDAARERHRPAAKELAMRALAED